MNAADFMSGHAVYVENHYADSMQPAQQSGMLLTSVSQAISCSDDFHQPTELHNSPL